MDLKSDVEIVKLLHQGLDFKSRYFCSLLAVETSAGFDFSKRHSGLQKKKPPRA